MKRRSNIFAILRVSGGIFAILLSFVFSASASAVRPVPVSLDHNGQLPGGFIDFSGGPGGTVRQYLGSTFSDSSSDGNLVVFTSSTPASTFVPGVVDFLSATPISNVFVRNMQTGETSCVSCHLFTGNIRSWTGFAPRITPNGRYIVYTGPDLAGSFTLTNQILRADLQTGALDVVSVGIAGTEGNINSYTAVISDDGRYVGFTSSATNLVAGFPSVNTTQLYVRDMQTNQTVLASHANGSISQPGNAIVDPTQPISISASGRYLVWTSSASNYLFFTPDSNGVNDVFFFDVFSSGINIGTASANTTGLATGNGASFGGIVSANSNSFPPTIVFASSATDLNSADTSPNVDIYCYKGESTARLVSVARDGSVANAASVSLPTITRSGRFIAFASKASNLVTGIDEVTNTTPDIFLRDLQANTTRYVSLSGSGQPSSTMAGASFPGVTATPSGLANGYLSRTISEDGRYVAFITSEPLSVRDNAGTQDVYVRDMTSGVSVLASLNLAANGGESGGIATTSDIALAAGGQKAFFTTFATNLFQGDTTNAQNSKAYEANISLLSERGSSDFDGDQKNDCTVFRPAEGNWYSLFVGSDPGYSSVLFGENGNRIAPGDYDGDGKADLGVFSPSMGRWDILQSSNNNQFTTFFGSATDILAPGDFDGDGRTDLTYFRPSTGTWFILQSNSGGLRSTRFGLNGDIPVVGDYDGDNRSDIAIFRPSTGEWWIQFSATNTINVVRWGLSTDKPVVADFDGDGRSDIAVYRAGFWYILNSRDGGAKILQWGLSDDRPVAADYDGDGKADVAVFRPSDGIWYQLHSSDDTVATIQWGTNGDLPIPAAYVP